MAGNLSFAVVVLGAAASVGAAVGLLPSSGEATTPGAGYAEAVDGCTVTDGDTIRCASERIRLLGIDTAELPGHCRTGRICVTGDPYAATASLRRMVAGTLTIDRVGQDRYGRTLARVAKNGADLSCWQLAHGGAIYKPGWDNGLRVARTCPTQALLPG